VLELQPGSGPVAETNIARILVLQGRYEEARAVVARLPDGELQDYGIALLHLAPGRRAEADAALKRLEANADDAVDKLHLAEVYAFRGMHDAAFALLQSTREALEPQSDQRPYLPGHFREELRLSPFLKPLRSDPRWPVLVASPG
jgi:thioredoxin-like negative regulator of GroEL